MRRCEVFFHYMTDVRVFFDVGSTHSFITPHVVCLIPIHKTILPYHLTVVTLNDVALLASEVLRDCEIKVCDKRCPGDLVVLDITKFDLILRMDWLFYYYAKVDY